eukprot:3429181-Alexandrium_andersonii.AAC.1
MRIGQRADVERGLRDSLRAVAVQAAASAAMQPEPKAAVGEALEQHLRKDECEHSVEDKLDWLDNW